MNCIIKICCLLHFILIVNITYSQIKIDASYTPQKLVNNVLIGGGVTISNIKYTGATDAIGYFNGEHSNIGIKNGVILSTGKVINAIGPNNDHGTLKSNSFYTNGDIDLDSLMHKPNFTKDAAILEFDFIPISDSIQFKYSFASEQYPTQVCSEYNDVFGFLLSGKNPTGGYYINENIALVPNTKTYVAINTINSCSSSKKDTIQCFNIDPNWRAYSVYFIDNEDGSIGTPQYSDSTVVQYNGFTKVLTAKAAIVPCQTYHIKLSIADGSDYQKNSAVFLEAKSFSGGLNIQTQTGDTAFKEGCKAAKIYFIRYVHLDSTITINFNLSGTAQNGIDYTDENGQPLPNKIVFNKHNKPLPTTDTIQLIIVPKYDGIDESTEPIILKVYNPFACVPDTIIKTLTIVDVKPINIYSVVDTAICKGNSGELKIDVKGGTSPYSYVWSNGEINETKIKIFSNQTTTYTITVNSACELPIDSAQIIVRTIIRPVANFNYENICSNFSTLFKDSSISSDGLINYWYWSVNGGFSLKQNVDFVFNEKGSYPVSLIVETDKGCKDTISKIVNIINSPKANFKQDNICVDELTVFSDSTLCNEGKIIYWNWDLGNGNIFSQLTNDEIKTTYNEIKDYNVQLIVRSDVGCVDTITKLVSIKDCNIIIPNVFTPNDDGINDYFEIMNSVYDWKNNFELTLFNRWGRIVYHSNDYKNNWNASSFDDGVYYYLLYSEKNNKLFKGFVHVIR